MKKILILIFLLNFPIFSQIKIVTTLHPFKDIIKQVAGEHNKVSAILKPGLSPHTYEVSPSEVNEITSADILFYGSKDLDAWALNFENNNKIELISLLPEDSLLYIYDINGESVGTDPHFWSDPLLVKILVRNLAEILCEYDSEGCSEYRLNAKQFSEELDDIYSMIDSTLSVLENKTVVLSHPFFSYFLRRFNFETAGVIEPIPGKEPTARDLKKIIDTIILKKAGTIFIHDQLPEKPAQIVSESTGIKIYTLDPIGGIEGRITYEELLLYNSEIISRALE